MNPAQPGSLSNTLIPPDSVARNLNHTHVSLGSFAVRAINSVLNINDATKTYSFGELADWIHADSKNIKKLTNMRNVGPATAAEILAVLNQLKLISVDYINKNTDPSVITKFKQRQEAHPVPAYQVKLNSATDSSSLLWGPAGKPKNLHELEKSVRTIAIEHKIIGTRAINFLQDNFWKLLPAASIDSRHRFTLGEVADWVNQSDFNLFFKHAGPKTSAKILFELCNLGLVHTGRVLHLACPRLKASFLELDRLAQKKLAA